MGAIAEGIIAFAQPLLDQTDGSLEDMNKALALAQLCYNLALLPEDQRDKMINEMQAELAMNDKEFADFRRGVIDPMIRRHEEMFPLMHGRNVAAVFPGDSWLEMQPRRAAPAQKKSAVIDRYAPCPCGSGKKYKFCCGMKGR